MSKKLLMNDFLNDNKLICWLDARDLKVGIPNWVDRKMELNSSMLEKQHGIFLWAIK